MIKVSAQTLFTASWKKCEINMRISDFYNNIHTVLRSYKNNYTVRTHRNKYCLNLKEFNFISQSYHSSLSYIIGRSDFQAKRYLKSMAADRNSITISN